MTLTCDVAEFHYTDATGDRTTFFIPLQQVVDVRLVESKGYSKPQVLVSWGHSNVVHVDEDLPTVLKALEWDV